MDMEIYYFSGTGNSFYVAKELQKRIPESILIPIVSLLHQDNITTRADSVGIIFPVHALTIPIAVKRFLKKVNLHSTKYIFAIATRGATFFRGFELIERLLANKGKRLHAQFILTMGMNDPRSEFYQSPTHAEILKLEGAVQRKLDSIMD
ncbi:MAG: EFR1 family ferrodoxin [Candidatus Atribacteria bacterium]|nr:EFR1 family ferrodoxin [Candidatus Atribacteria bacterium]